jgi:hypothetical protein
MENITLEKVNQYILRKQHLDPGFDSHDLIEVISDVGGLHATGSATPYLSMFNRNPEFNSPDLYKAYFTDHSVGRIRCIRKTIFTLTRDMMPIFHQATASMVSRASFRFMNGQGIAQETYDELSARIFEYLASGEKTIYEIKHELKIEDGLSAILYFMCDQGLLIRGRPIKDWRDNRHSYACFVDYFPDLELHSVSEEDAILYLVEIYLKSFGPVTENDITWWTGLGKTKVRNALNVIRDNLIQLQFLFQEGEYLMFDSDWDTLQDLESVDQTVINLLPTLDPYLMGYKDRLRYLDDRYREYIFDKTGNVTSTILINGQIRGIWGVENKDRSTIKIFLFDKLSNDTNEQIIHQAQRMGKFIEGKDVGIKICKTMTPLSQRTVGGFLTPLKDCS